MTRSELRGNPEDFFESILYDMSIGLLEQEADVEKVVDRLQKVLPTNFSYSKARFSACVAKIVGNWNIPDYIAGKDGLYDGETFLYNLEAVKDFVEKNLKDEADFYASFFELYDFLFLEANRFLHNKVLLYYSNYPMYQSLKELEEIREELEHAMKITREAEERTSKIQTDVVTIIAIFAAIVISFASGAQYVSGALRGMHCTPLPKVVAVLSFSGLILANSLFLLMFFVGKVTGRPLEFKGKALYLFNAFLLLVFITLFALYCWKRGCFL